MTISNIENSVEIKKKMATKYGLPGIAVDWLRGENEAEIEEDSKKLAKFMGIDDQPKSVDQMSPEEIRTIADKLLQQYVEEWKPKWEPK